MGFLTQVIQAFTPRQAQSQGGVSVAYQDESTREQQRAAYVLGPGVMPPRTYVKQAVGYGVKNDQIGLTYPVGAQQGNQPLLNTLTPQGVGVAVPPNVVQSGITFSDALIEPGGGLHE